MSVEDKGELLEFLTAFDPAIQSLALDLREWVWGMYPECVELIYDGPAALAFGWTPTGKAGDIFLSIALYTNRDVLFGFMKGSVLHDPDKLLEGDGKYYRYVRITDRSTMPETAILKLLEESYDNSVSAAKPVKDVPKGSTFVRGRSENKRRPKK